MKDEKGNMVFELADKDIVERESFGHFEVLIAKQGALFKTYTGYHVWASKYAVGVDGKAGQMTLFSWLSALVRMKKDIAGHEEEPYGDDRKLTNGEVLETLMIVTEANMTAPMTVFADEERAIKAARSYIEWLTSYMKILDEEMAKKPEEPDEKMEFEALESARIIDNMKDLMP